MSSGRLLEELECLLAAARSPDDAAPRAAYCAEARRVYDRIADQLKTHHTNLCSLEAHLLGKSALLEEPKK